MDFLFYEVVSKPLWLWLMFLTIVVTLMVFDLGVLNKDDHEIGVAESLKLSAFYIAIAIGLWWLYLVGMVHRHAGHQLTAPTRLRPISKAISSRKSSRSTMSS